MNHVAQTVVDFPEVKPGNGQANHRNFRRERRPQPLIQSLLIIRARRKTRGCRQSSINTTEALLPSNQKRSSRLCRRPQAPNRSVPRAANHLAHDPRVMNITPSDDRETLPSPKGIRAICLERMVLPAPSSPTIITRSAGRPSQSFARST